MTTDLEHQAERFAEQLTALASAFRGQSHPFVARHLGDKIVIRSAESIPASTASRVLFSVVAEYRCTYDHAATYLVIHESSIKVFAGSAARGDPVCRFEYVRDQVPDLPSAHVHVHAHRDQLTVAMAMAGIDGASRRRSATLDDYMRGARMAELHLPMGGHRFRPGLEDVLQWLEAEFGVVTGGAWPEELIVARSQYRRGQTAAAVRDCPSGAVRALRDLGYVVTEPVDGPPEDRNARLAAF